MNIGTGALIGGAVAGLVGGAVAEHVLSGASRGKAEAHGAWESKYDRFMKSNPAPEGTTAIAVSTPDWLGSAQAVGLAATTGALGGAAILLGNKLNSSAFGVLGLAAATAGATGILGASISASLRNVLD